ncbi:hypothetical protein A4H97_32425 [Niastella yeongjuensis]|uniref:PKD domain-containing protein n=1 Tax=Niastella yeongjuensis TaxID=354355 RepID=A0A1V9EHC0_9BACT|nr:gliding motility-associated C-terminal domain-containing protein [Niastella yeongjuensis]OQP45451.1 hypothetical protein A4H97_32425 [Niastella yeongjuensis]SEO76265.1 gliding motility-associated C-terminal domain-containing protein [Niastella yeongjuensis]
MKFFLFAIIPSLLFEHAFSQVTIQFTTPDTVCMNTPVNITNTSLNASTYYWNFCVGNINTPPDAFNIGNPGNLSVPVFMDYVYTNNNYYAFVSNHGSGHLVRLDFGSSLLNTPTAVDLGNYGGILEASSAIEGIQVVQNEGNWYAIIVGGTTIAGTQPRIVKIDFGASITSPGQATNWGNIGNIEQPIDLHVFKEGNNWYGFTLNSENNTITRFDFTNSFNNTPTAVNLGNIGGLQYPTGIYAINDNGFWRVFISNGGDNRQIGTNSSITRLDFGNSLLNTPTGVNLGNPGGQLHHPRDFIIMKFCGQIIGFAVNGNPSYYDLLRLDFNNDLTSAPTITSLGNTGNYSFPHSISRLFRANDEVYAFITNAANNTISRLRFAGCTNASISSSTLQDPLPVSYSTPGTYNINLTIDDGLPTQTSLCKQVVVLPPLVHTPAKTVAICNGDNIKIGTGVKNAKYTWNTGGSTDSIIVNTSGTYWVQTDRFGCTNRDSIIVSYLPAPAVNLGPDIITCQLNNLVLDAGNTGAAYLWQDGSAFRTFTANSFGKYYVKVTGANGCVMSDTITLTQKLTGFADFFFKQDVCDPLAVQLISNGNNLTNPYWSFGDGNSITGNLSPSYRYPAFGNYTVKMGIEVNGCKDTITKIIAVNLVNNDIIFTPDTTICFNTSAQLRAYPALSSCWSPATYLSDPTIPAPITTTPEKITYYYTAEVPGNNLVINGDFSNGNNNIGSSYKYTTQNTGSGEYTVGPNAQAWNPLLAGCQEHTGGSGNMLIVHGNAQVNEKMWSQSIPVQPNTNYAFSAWVQGTNPNAGSSNSPQLQFSINGLPAGNIFQPGLTACGWNQHYIVWNSGNNTSADIAIVNQHNTQAGNDFALDDLSFAPVTVQREGVTISIDTPFVKTINDTIVCTSSPVPLTASGAVTWSWTPTTGLSDAAISNPVATPNVPTAYIVTGTNINGCSAKDTVQINLFLVPTIISNHDILACPNTAVQLSANNALTSFAWTPAATLNDPALANPIATPSQNTTYQVQVTDVNNCIYSDSVHVLFRTIQFAAAGTNGAICQGKPIALQATGGDTYVWNPATFLDNANSATPIAKPDTSMLYNVYIKESNCNHDTTIAVQVLVNPAPAVTAEKTNDLDCLVHSAKLSATGSVGSVYRWFPTSRLDHPEMPNPVTTTDTTITYVVTGTNKFGCSTSDSVTVYVTATGKISFEVPNAFTPNGDGRNDCLGVKSWGGVQMEEFSIFNRWGQRVFTTNRPGVCWDGRFRGEPQPADGYAYVIKAKTYCGPIKRTGVIMLIR